jgi:Domain of unknown function (DUF222)
MIEQMFDTLDELEAAVDKLAASEAEPDVARLSRLAERLEYQRLRAVAALDRGGAWQADGALSSASWLREHCRLTHGAATASVRLARRLESMPATSDAFEAGAISRQHAQTIAEAFTSEREPALREVEPQLVDAARSMPVRQFRSLVSYVTDALDGDCGAASANAQYERQQLHASRLLDGMVALDGVFGGEGGEIVLTALNAAMDPPSPGDLRSPAQRRADALVDICRVAMSRLATGPGRARRPHVNVDVALEVLERRGGVDLVRGVRSDAAHIGHLSAETLRRISCDGRRPHRHPRRFATSGRRPDDAHDPVGVVAGACRARRGLCCSGMRSSTWLVRRAPPRALGRRRRDQPGELRARCRRHHRAVHEGTGKDPPEP